MSGTAIADAQKWVEMHEMVKLEHQRWSDMRDVAAHAANDTKASLLQLEDNIADWAIEYLAAGYEYDHLAIQLRAVEAGKDWSSRRLRNLVRRRRAVGRGRKPKSPGERLAAQEEGR